jgi:hypothetical protein
MPVLDDALNYLRAGLSVLPADAAGKRPAVASWKEYQDRLPTEDEVRAWFAKDRALCIVAGNVSGNLEMIDFDCAGEKFAWWKQLVEHRAPGLLARLVIERSPSGGWHVVYRIPAAPCGNIKLAERAIPVTSKQEVEFYGRKYVPREVNGGLAVCLTLIETRAEGGLFLCAPTPGYELVQGRFEEVLRLSDQEREVLLEAAWSQNELRRQPEPVPDLPADPAAGTRPGDDYNARGDVRAVLRKHGWTLARQGENEYWRRPGKTDGWSATLKDGMFFVHSSNAAPFEPSRAYNAFTVYAKLEHGGDYSQAAGELRREGYGAEPQVGSGTNLDAFGKTITVVAEPKSIGQLMVEYPTLRDPVVHQLLRQGETMNIIAASKVGKSWLAADLALAIATWRPWLGEFQTETGEVLIIDNELHRETSAHRIPKVAQARGIPLSEYHDRVRVENLRGRLLDIHGLGRYFDALKPGRYRIIILDAFYRFMPRDTDENDNGAMANIYNVLDCYAERLGCSFVLIHHASKGNQSGKSVTDVGAGAGSQSRATDTHVIMRAHEEPGCVVFEAAVRSWPPVDPFCLRWAFPVWNPDPALDPTALRSDRQKRAPKEPPAPRPSRAEWTPEDFIEMFVSREPRAMSAVISEAVGVGLSERRARKLIQEAVDRRLAYRWRYGANQPIDLATVEKPHASAEG